MKRLGDTLYLVEAPGELGSLIDAHLLECFSSRNEVTVYDEDVEPSIYPYVVHLEIRCCRSDMILVYVPKSAFDN